MEQTPGDSIHDLYVKIRDLMDTYRANEVLLNIISNKEIKLPNFDTTKLVHNKVISVSEAKNEILNHKNHKNLQNPNQITNISRITKIHANSQKSKESQKSTPNPKNHKIYKNPRQIQQNP